MIRFNKNASGAADWPSAEVGEAHALVVRSRQQALDCVADILEQSTSLVISPWNEKINASWPDTRVVVWKHLTKYRPQAFSAALKRMSAMQSTIIYIADVATSEPYQIQPVIDKTLCHCAQALNKAIIVILVDVVESALQKTIVSPHLGYSSFHTLSGDEINTWRVHFWFKNGHVFRDVVYQSLNSDTSSKAASDTFRLGRDAPKFVVADALEKGISLPTGWRQVETYNNLLDFIEPGVDGTIILGATKQHSFPEVVKVVHRLRLHAGNFWKIFVLERDRVIRMSEEKVLLSAGATLVIPQQLPLYRVLSLTESFVNWEFDNALPELAVLLDRLDETKLHGIVEAKLFFQTVPNIAQRQYQQGVDFTLVFAHLARGVSLEDVLSRVHLERSGDLISYTREGIYIFLPACRVSDANKVLFGIFQMPISHLFSHEERATGLRSVELICEKGLQAEHALPTNPIELAFKAAPQSALKQELHYYPKPEPAKLSSERN